MKVFLSYSRADSVIAERIAANLKQAGHEVFFDQHNIKVAEDFNRVIWGEIQKADLFVFLISPHSVQAGSYALTELSFAEKKWPNPERKVLTVVIEPIDFTDIPIYASICHMLQPEGSIAAEVRAEINSLHKSHRLKKIARWASIIAAVVVFGTLTVLGYQEYLDQVPFRARAKLATMNVPFDQANFFYSSSRGDLDMINLFLDAGMDPNFVYNQKTALMAAIDGEHYEVINVLIKANSDVNAKAFNLSVLGIAVRHGQEDTVRTLLKVGIDDNIVNAEFPRARTISMMRLLLSREVTQTVIDEAFVRSAGEGKREQLLFLVDKISNRSKVASKALLKAASIYKQQPSSEQIEILKNLFNLGADVNTKDKTEVTPLILVAHSESSQLVKLFLENGADPNLRCILCTSFDGHDWTPLTMALRNHSTVEGNKVVNLLLAGGADVNLARKDGMKPLMLAIKNRGLQVIQTLLKAGANINIVRKDGTTPLMLAIKYKNLQVVQTLLKAGKSINLARKDGTTPLMLAIENGELQVVQTLLKAGANINDQDDTGKTALSDAATYGNEDMLAELFSRGADIHNGYNPLLPAVRNNHYQIMEILLAKGADINKSDSEGRTALMWAAITGHSDIVRTLLASGARTSDKDKKGRTAEVFAKREKNSEVIELLQDTAK